MYESAEPQLRSMIRSAIEREIAREAASEVDLDPQDAAEPVAHSPQANDGDPSP